MALADEMIKTLMKNLDCDEETAKDVIECDKRIDKGEKLFELPKELEKGAKKARNAGNCKGYTKANREKKIDEDKLLIMAHIKLGLKNWFQSNSEYTYNACTKFDEINPEREMTFEYKGKKFKVVLSCPRN